MPKTDRLARTLVNASMEFYRRRTWRGVRADALFTIRVPGEEEPLAGGLVGPGTGDFGLFLSRGEDALGRLLRLQSDAEIGGERFEQCDHLVVLFVRLGELRDDLRRLLDVAGFQTRRERIAPCLGAKPPGLQLRPPNKREQKTLAWCLAAVLAAEDQGELNPGPLEPGGEVLELQVDGKLTAPEVTARWVPVEVDELGALEAPALLPEELASEPRNGEPWCVAVSPLPGPIEGDDRMYHSVVILNEETENVLSATLVPGSTPGHVVEPLIETLRELGLPARIVFNRETLIDALAPALAGLEVETALVRDHPLMEEAIEDLDEFLHTGGFEDEGQNADEGPPTTLEDWKRAELDFCYRTSADLDEKEVVTPRALKQYFGSEELGWRVLEELEDMDPLSAFVEWVAADFRPNKRTKPYFDRRLEEPDLDDVERALIESRRGALLSYFRVLSTEPGSSLEVEDVRDGRRYTVYDDSLSAAELEGCLIPMRLFQLDRWYVPAVAGPPLSPEHCEELLQGMGGPGTSDEERSRAGAHLLGRIWVGCLGDDRD